MDAGPWGSARRVLPSFGEQRRLLSWAGHGLAVTGRAGVGQGSLQKTAPVTGSAKPFAGSADLSPSFLQAPVGTPKGRLLRGAGPEREGRGRSALWWPEAAGGPGGGLKRNSGC